MDWRTAAFDWNKARAFLVTAEEGSLSAAARQLGLTQPTLGRQVAGLEEELGVALFERAGRGLVLTPSGLEMMDHARAMGEAAGGLSRVALGQSQSVEGLVRITASDITSAYVLPSILAKLRADHPGIQVEVVATNEIRDLGRREADIALRNARPSDPHLIARKLAPGEAHLYTTAAYLEDLGAENGEISKLSDGEFIGFPENGQLIEVLNNNGLPVSEENFVLTSASILVQWQMVQQGLGIGIMTQSVGDTTPGVIRAIPQMAAFGYEHWIVAHRELSTNRRLRIVFDALVAALG